MTEKSTKVRELLLAGTKYPEITRQTGAASSTIAYHAKKMGLGKFTFERKAHDWNAIQAYYDDGYCISEVVEHFNIEWSVLSHARNRGVIQMNDRNRPRKVANERRYTDEFIFSVNETISFPVVKNRYKALSKYACIGVDCLLAGIDNPDWAGRPIVLHLDHKNGKRSDHRLTNLRWLCPNCHSQTSTYCGRNKGK